jgi:hypothetical protein
MTDMLYGHADVKHETHPTAVLNDGGKMMTPKRNKQPPEKSHLNLCGFFRVSRIMIMGGIVTCFSPDDPLL